jgi:hypothetical protein
MGKSDGYAVTEIWTDELSNKKQLTAENAGIAEENQEIGLETWPTKKVSSFARMSICFSLCSEPVPE